MPWLTAIFLSSITFGAFALSSWNVTAPVQCSNFTIAWSGGGTPPFEVTLVAISGPGYDPVDVSGLPGVFDMNATAHNEWSIVLPYPAHTAFVFVVSDATGFGSGGTSSVFFVGNSTKLSCLPTNYTSDIDFTFAMTHLMQCQSSNFTFVGAPEPPISILAVLPSLPGGANAGQSSLQLFEVPSSTLAAGATEAGYDVSVGPVRLRSGSQVVILVGDKRGRAVGGWSQLYAVQYSSDTACLASVSSSNSTAAAPSMTSAPTAASGSLASSSCSKALVRLLGGIGTVLLALIL